MIKNLKQKKVLEGHKSGVNSATFSCDGKYIVSSSQDKTVRIWDVSSDKQTLSLDEIETIVNGMKENPGRKYSWSKSYDGSFMMMEYNYIPLSELMCDIKERFKDRSLSPEELRLYYIE